MEPEITVLIPVRNGEDFIAEAIESVLHQTFTRWTLVISDNCSTDRTRTVVSRYLSDPRVRLLESDTNLGMAGNFNKCLDAVRTRYYFLLCHDDFLYAPHALEAGYAALEGNPAAPTVYCDLMYVARDGGPIVARRFKRRGLVDCLTLARRSIITTRNLFGIPLLARAAALGDLRFDPSLPYIIDLDLSIATAKGRPVYHIPEPLIANRYHGKNRTGLLVRGFVGQMAAMARKHDIPLKRRDLAMMRLFACYTTVARQAFLAYARRVNRARSAGCRSHSADVKHAP